MLRAASELGYRETNVQDVIERAGVSRPTFYEHFANKEDCFLAAFDTSAERLRDKVDAAAAQGWRQSGATACASAWKRCCTSPPPNRTPPAP